MKHSILIFSFLFSGALRAACHLSPLHDFVLLSGGVTHYLEEFHLLKEPVKAISIFSGVTKKSFKGDILSGGVFLSSSQLKRYKNPIVVFDQSREQRLDLSHTFSDKQLIEIETKDKTPLEVMREIKQKFDHFLVDCETGKKIFETKIAKVEQEIKKALPWKQTILFFLGELKKGGKLPPLLMVNDGLVLWLKNEKKITTYPSPLSYVSWSEKMLLELEKKQKIILVGLDSSGEELSMEEVEKSDRRKLVNIKGPRILTPGPAQIETAEFLIRNLKNF